ncbi:hypothetical protein R3P38DRAFT_2765341 [Favolaschia claudopus]|uniref:Uncharacterized protein n=1 Tax=Favolaschia claudopus TaxID=2862362 RepID=A0AAW0D6Q6_9AGAR
MRSDFVWQNAATDGILEYLDRNTAPLRPCWMSLLEGTWASSPPPTRISFRAAVLLPRPMLSTLGASPSKQQRCCLSLVDLQFDSRACLGESDWAPSIWIGKNVSGVVPASLLTAGYLYKDLPSICPIRVRPMHHQAMSSRASPRIVDRENLEKTTVVAYNVFAPYANGMLVGSLPDTTNVWKTLQILSNATNLSDGDTCGAVWLYFSLSSSAKRFHRRTPPSLSASISNLPPPSTAPGPHQSRMVLVPGAMPSLLSALPRASVARSPSSLCRAGHAAPYLRRVTSDRSPPHRPPIIPKGIQTWQDALACLHLGFPAVY